MSKPLIQRSVRFDPDQYAAVEKLAAKEKRTVADLLRIIIDKYLSQQNALTESQLRMARVTEYSQAALDAIILENHPEFREQILIETNRRMERYHGAR